MNEPALRVAVGRVTRAHGITGQVVVLPLTDVQRRFEPGSVLLLGESGERRVTVTDRSGTAARPLVRFREIADRTAAESIAGEYLFVTADASPALPPDEFWPYQLTGLEVVTSAGERIGTMRDVLRTPANDVWVVVDASGRETLVPALKDVVLRVDPAAGRITVAAIPGLTTPS